MDLVNWIFAMGGLAAFGAGVLAVFVLWAAYKTFKGFVKWAKRQ